MLEYKNLKYTEIDKFNRDKTIFLMALSPLETHGPHLPVGTDLIVAEKLLERYEKELKKKFPEYNIIKLPSLPLGSSLLPVEGSIEIKARNLEKILYDIVSSLSNLGFKYLFLADNHGGPAHQMAIEAVVRKASKRLNFILIDPFNYIFKLMIENDSKLLEFLNSSPGEIGDDLDLHAGNNETSLMLYFSPEEVGDYERLKDSLIPEYKGLSLLLKKIANLINSKSLSHLAVNLAWISDNNITPYLGKPAEANSIRGGEMVEARVKIAVKLFEKAINGNYIQQRPLLWKLRFLRYFF